ncbi:MAG: thermonuclease family protein [Lachnospiraceae bacterium]|nr:thermonuclease family protein [Lachnospiraceae bacterium]
MYHFFFSLFFVYSSFSNLVNDDFFLKVEEYKRMNPDFVPAKVVNVVDGDTIDVLIDDEKVRVRFIGVDTPESVNPDESKNCKEGKAASDYTSSFFENNPYVFLEYDRDVLDPYDRTLAYVWTSKAVDTSDYNDFLKYNYNALLLENTYCDTMCIEPNDKYAKWFESIK